MFLDAPEQIKVTPEFQFSKQNRGMKRLLLPPFARDSILDLENTKDDKAIPARPYCKAIFQAQ